MVGLGAPLGRTEDRALASLWFDRESGGAAMVGPSGRGVSSAIRAAVTALAVLYPPDELQMLLVGLGERRDLAVFGAHRLPHAVLVATNTERELGGAVLDAAVRELVRRERRFADAGTGRLGLAGHRARTGDQLARLLVVMDGVAELSAVDDTLAAAATRDLRRLADDGPAFGIHLLLADRCSSGTPAEQACLDVLPSGITTLVRFGDDDEGLRPGDATLEMGGGAGRADPHDVDRTARAGRRPAGPAPAGRRAGDDRRAAGHLRRRRGRAAERAADEAVG